VVVVAGRFVVEVVDDATGRFVVGVVEDEVATGRVVVVDDDVTLVAGRRPWQAEVPASVNVFPAWGRNSQS
jgi:hypothetical protein